MFCHPECYFLAFMIIFNDNLKIKYFLFYLFVSNFRARGEKKNYVFPNFGFATEMFDFVKVLALARQIEMLALQILFWIRSFNILASLLRIVSS